MKRDQFLKCPVLIMLVGQLWNVFKKLIEPLKGFGRFERSSLNFQVN